MTTDNEQALPKRIKKPAPQSFTMDDFEDESRARKFIRPSFDDIRQRLKDEGTKTQFRKARHEDGVQSYAIFYGREVTDKKGNKSIVYSDNDYLAIHFDPSRKFQGNRRPRNNKDGEKNKGHKQKRGKVQPKMRQEGD